MSELMNTSHRGNFRLHLLASVSVAVLMTVGLFDVARADDNTDRPTVWIELGGQLQRNDSGLDAFAPPFANAVAQGGFTSPLAAQRPAKYSNGFDGTLSFQPEGSDWSFSAAILYGRSNAKRHIHQEKTTPPIYWSFTFFGQADKQTASIYNDYTDDRVTNNETHAVVDFQAGKDVGLGMFGNDATLGFGVRIAQFSSKANVMLYARPDGHFVQRPFGFASDVTPKYKPFPQYHDYKAFADAVRSFRGLGPSIALKASIPLVGEPRSAEFAFDWGLNAAFLFGRQKAIVHHHSLGTYHYATNAQANFGSRVVNYPHSVTKQSANQANRTAARSVLVPNLGGFAGLSLKFPNAKVSLGYRADFFFSAMDGGIDAAKKENRGFYGPFANISVGIGG